MFRDADDDEDDTETGSVTPGGSPRAASTVSPGVEVAPSPLLPPFDPPPDDEAPDGEFSETVALTRSQVFQLISDQQQHTHTHTHYVSLAHPHTRVFVLQHD